MHKVRTGAEDVHAAAYAGRWVDRPVPKFAIPAQGLSADAAYCLVHDELNLDGNPALNLASFVTPWMEPQAEKLATETLGKNMIDQDEYPQTEAIHERVVTMIGRLFHAPHDETPIGTATIGSSEAIMLAMLAHRQSWRDRRRAAGLSIDRPNLVIGADVHTCWEKFTRYFDVEARVVPMQPDSFTLTAADVEAHVDDCTIAVGGLLGTTFTGQIDELAAIDGLLQRLRVERGWHVPLHIDAASGGFLAPFTRPDLAWDFRLPSVRSINVSNHKFGLVYPGMGTVVFRDRSDLPDELVFHINYLGGDMPNYSLNFSRPSNSVILQYYNFLRFGREGYARIAQAMVDNAQALSDGLLATGAFEALHDRESFPVVVVRAKDPEQHDVYALSDRLRERGWIVPAYSLPPNAEHVEVLRMVVKESFSRDMVDLLLDDMRRALANGSTTSREHAPAKGERTRPLC
ncbi:MAG TPA: glutamate decarboxylase [Conexibacter sp.]|jgi:glutamate decarboxylase|nr:glutamate decarboxylase [Conexibacter sp.]